MGIVFIRQNLMSTHVRFSRIKTVPGLKGLNNMALEAHRTQWVKVIQRARTFWLISVYQLQLKQQALTQRFYNAGPASVTLVQRYKKHWANASYFSATAQFLCSRTHVCRIGKTPKPYKDPPSQLSGSQYCRSGNFCVFKLSRISHFWTFHEAWNLRIINFDDSSAIIIIIFTWFLNSRICPPREIREN